MNNDIDCPGKGWSIFYHTEFLVSLFPCPLSVGIYSDVIVMQDVSTKDSLLAIWAYLGQRCCRGCTKQRTGV